jgi:hypothetical protein
MFPVHRRKRLTREAAHNWVEKFSQGRLKVSDDGRPGADVGLDALVKRWDKCFSAGGGYVEK